MAGLEITIDVASQVTRELLPLYIVASVNTRQCEREAIDSFWLEIKSQTFLDTHKQQTRNRTLPLADLLQRQREIARNAMQNAFKKEEACNKAVQDKLAAAIADIKLTPSTPTISSQLRDIMNDALSDPTLLKKNTFGIIDFCTIIDNNPIYMTGAHCLVTHPSLTFDECFDGEETLPKDEQQ